MFSRIYLYAQKVPRDSSRQSRKEHPVYYSSKKWPHVVYGTLLGASCGIGVTYDTRFNGKRSGFGIMAGAGVVPEYEEGRVSRKLGTGADSLRYVFNTTYHVTPTRPTLYGGFNYVFGLPDPDKHCVEIGAGMTYMFGDSLWFEEGVSSRTLLGWLSVAGRRHFINKHFMFRMGAMLMFSSNQVTPNLDTGFGYCF
ncbi:hypothetical protein SAMN04488128_102822 [Chitinophaga eiseniae]|uniref:Outer membrane protein beta-barrel domain-containing protein n=1 Tax=Chitinophaga eiseniae TaxID=634771 RepID=A0A1T4R3V2_9BACT|nr:hypothetical protein [Chitinophaga eiseniae]SKA10649.1 hypothetical protein SAMN04488128_102822 [Chitinophaga eiseniae]